MKPNFGKITNSDKNLIIASFFFVKNFRCNIANVFWVVCFKKRGLKVFETPGLVFLLEGFAQVASVFTFCLPSFNLFSMTVFEREIIGQSVLTWLRILAIFLGISVMR